jgi:hypothetical protein
MYAGELEQGLTDTMGSAGEQAEVERRAGEVTGLFQVPVERDVSGPMRRRGRRPQSSKPPSRMIASAWLGERRPVPLVAFDGDDAPLAKATGMKGTTHRSPVRRWKYRSAWSRLFFQQVGRPCAEHGRPVGLSGLRPSNARCAPRRISPSLLRHNSARR